MKMRMQVDGKAALIAEFTDKRRKGGSAEATVEFTAEYAPYVHEAVEMKLKGQPRKSGIGRYWDPQGKATARFLTKAVDQLGPDLQDTINRTLKRGLHLWQALSQHATKVMKLAQKMTPVETGKLRASARVNVRKS